MSLGVDSSARIVFVQHGDFREAALRLASGGGETFHAQRYSMEIVERLAAETALTAVVRVGRGDVYRERLEAGVEAIGLGDDAELHGLLAELRPTHVVLRTPERDTLLHCLALGARVLPSFADSFSPRAGLRGLKDRIGFRRLASALNRPEITVVGNHNVAAAESLASIGVDPRRIVPWDWPRSPRPPDFAPKTAPAGPPWRLVTVGSVGEAKGMGDAIRALAADTALREGATLEIVGAGEIEAMRSLAADLGVEDRVSFTGRVPFAEVAPRMHDADAVLVLSRHAYAEGLPGTIYLALASRTPLVVSDHPMFVSYLRDGRDAVITPERAPEALASALRGLLSDSDLYAALSTNAEAAFARIEHPVLWVELVERWLRDAPDDRAWLRDAALPRWRRSAA